MVTLMFANDNTMFMKGSNIEEMEDKLNHELIKINNWLNVNKLSLNI